MRSNTNKAGGVNRKPVKLPNWTERRMISYVLVAGASLAGPSLTCTKAAAEVIFTRDMVMFPAQPIVIDMDADGVNDFGLEITVFSSTKFRDFYLVAVGMQPSASIAESPKEQIYAEPLFEGSVVGSRHQFRPAARMASAGTNSSAVIGPWADVYRRYLGVKFLINGQTHYGWIGFRRVLGQPHGFFTANLFGFAYETQAGKPIVAGDMGGPGSTALIPKPTTLELLAAGHSGLAEARLRLSPEIN